MIKMMSRMEPHVHRKLYEKVFVCMDTTVIVKAVSALGEEEVGDSLSQAAAAFYRTERACSRFDKDSELTQLLRHPKKRIKASPLLFQAIKFGLEVARETNGLFDPTIGRQMEKRGFNENYLSGEKMDSTFADGTHPSYKDVILNESDRTVYLKKPLVIDLGAIAKGMAIDLAAKVLKPFPGFIVDAGGDIYAGGKNERNRPWRIGIKHPIKPAEVIGSIGLSDAAICTSGSYERISPLISNEHHLFNPLIGGSPSKMVSCTVIAPFAILADAFSTASFVMGVPRGLEQMKKMHLGGLMITSSLNLYMTDQFKETWLWKKV